ncbi:hypothetical protein N7493_010785 [Penicillium malachiteum]|uniref:Uncharacterized protein n=1 Tax=Penicillium malachiteum TaxID=1324776 RepID=A0AAD6HDD8_9EURO|nr:hypothetical protein N7493_010785 [Penicillium malachiteum]
MTEKKFPAINIKDEKSFCEVLGTLQTVFISIINPMDFDFSPFIRIGINGRVPHAATREDTGFTATIFSLYHAAALRRAYQEAKGSDKDLLEDEIDSQLHDTLRELIVLFKLAELHKWDHLGKNITTDVIALLCHCSMVSLKMRLRSAEGQSILDEITCSDQPSQDAFFVSV